MKIYYYNFYRGFEEIKIQAFDSQNLEFEFNENCRVSINSFNKPMLGRFIGFKELNEKEIKVAHEAAKNYLFRMLR